MDNIKNEIWRSIEGFDPKFQVSNMGRVRNTNWRRSGKTRIVPTYVHPHTGYPQVRIWVNGGFIARWLHRIVAKAFIPNPDGLEQVDHINNNRQDCRVANLRWVSRKFNNSRPHARKMKSMNRRKFQHDNQVVRATRLEDGEILWFKTITQASRFVGCSHVMGLKVAGGQFKQAKGWKLEYVDRSEVCIERLKQIDSEYAKRAGKKQSIHSKLKEAKLERRKLLGSQKGDNKAVLQIKDGVVVKEWKNMWQAKKAFKGNWRFECAVYEVLDEYGGFKWRFKRVV